jgi:hypothetical protein
MSQNNETIADLQRLAVLVTRQGELDEESITRTEESESISRQIEKENQAYRDAVASENQNYKSQLERLKENSLNQGLKKIASAVPPLPLSSVETIPAIEEELELLTPTDSFFHEANEAFSSRLKISSDWSYKGYLWAGVSLLICGGATAYAFVANIDTIKKSISGTPGLLFLGYFLCLLPVIIWLVVVSVLFLKSIDWDEIRSKSLSPYFKKKLAAMKKEDAYERDLR